MDQRRLLLAFALSLLVLLAYERLVLTRYTKHPDATPQTADVMPPPAQQEARAPGGTPPEEAVPASGTPVTIETDVLKAALTPAGARLTALQLVRYRQSVAPDSPPLELVAPGAVLPLDLDLGAGVRDSAIVYTPDRAVLSLHGEEEGEILFTGEAAGGLRIEKRIAFRGDAYLFRVTVSLAGGRPQTRVGLTLPPMAAEDNHGQGQEVALELVDRRLHQMPLAELTQDEAASPAPPARDGALRWAGFATQYFLAVALPAGGEGRGEMGSQPYLVRGHACEPGELSCGAGPKRGWRCQGNDRACDSGAETGDGACDACAVRVPMVTVESPVEGGRAGFEVFIGPKDQAALARADHDLDRALDFGYFWFVALPLLRALRLLHDLIGNWGVAIILLTTLVKVATIPLTQVTYRNMREMQKLQPQMQRLRERYKDDQASLQKEMMELYRRHRVNPLSGCLPMLLQIPIFIGLYNALMYAIELRHAPFALWIDDLSAPDRLMVMGWGVPVLTLLMGATMFVQQWLTPAQGDPTQQRMMMIMPLVFTFMFINFPAGLVLYWLVNNVITIGQQYAMMRSA